MSLEGIVIALLLMVGTVALVAAPLFGGARRRSTADAGLQKRRERLLVYYERVITNVRDLDEDRATGKLAEADYETERETWVQRGIEVLKALEALEAAAPTSPPVLDDAALDREIDDAIEAAVAAHRGR